MKRIIVPVDFSEQSEFALKAAALIASRHDSELIVLHMLELSDAILTKNDDVQSQKMIFFMKLAEQRFKEFLDKPYLQGVKVTPAVKHFKVFSEVNDVAQKHDADLIVMGSHGASGLKEFFIGSNTERVVRNSDIPVLVIKNEHKALPFSTVVFATDFDIEDVDAYRKARAFFDKYETRMVLLYVNLPNENFRSSQEVESMIAAFLQEADGNLDNSENVAYQADYTVEQGVLHFANKIGANAIAISTHGRKGISHFFAGSIGEDIANHADMPVITFKI